MNWTDVTAAPAPAKLRQFAGLWLVFFVGMASWRAWQRGPDEWTWIVGGLGLVVGLIGLVKPAAIRWVFTGWMIAAFPIGWTISRVMLGILFFAVFTPVALLFKATGRDVLRLRKPNARSYWITKTGPPDSAAYLRQY